MSSWWEMFAPKRRKNGERRIADASPIDEINPKDLPVGQISVNTNVSFHSMVNNLLGDFNSINGKFPIEFLGLIDTLSIINPDMSQAISNIVLLANTGHSIELESGDVEQAAAALSAFAAKIYPRSAGIDGLINSLFSQVCRSGAISMEWVPDLDLSKGLRKVQIVPVSSIRWVYDADPNVTDFYATQITNQHVQNVRLNPYTYIYYALDTLDDSPYAIPPFLSALENIYIQRDMVSNLKYISKKMGLLGFLNLMVSAPKQTPGETETAYKARATAYLQTVAKQVKDNFRDGIAVGFKDAQEFKHTSVTGDARGAAELFKSNEEMVFSGLKSDPSMQGRTYSTTETYAGVVFEKMLAQHLAYQRLVKRSLEYGARLHLALLGIDIAGLSYKFNPGKSANLLAEQQAIGQKITNARMMWEDGIISQQQRAAMLGYDSPDQDEPRVDPTAEKAENPKIADAKQTVRMAWNRDRNQYEFERARIIVPAALVRP